MMTERQQRWLMLSLMVLGTSLVIILGAHFQAIPPAVGQPAVFQQRFGGPEPEQVAALIYETYPEFPLENQYKRQRGKKPATDSTLLSRLIQYHTIVKGRSPQFRLDWKISFADYMGLNDYLDERVYPGKAFLTENPMESDMLLIRGFNRAQRAKLVQALADLHSGRPIAAGEVGSDADEPSEAVETTAPSLPSLPQPGAADLLR